MREICRPDGRRLERLKLGTDGGPVHWLLLVPYYFFTALLLAFALLLFSRLARLNVSLDRLTTAAGLAAIAAVALPLVTGWARIEDYRAGPMILLLLASFALAGLDTLVGRWLRLPLDRELESPGAVRHRSETATGTE